MPFTSDSDDVVGIGRATRTLMQGIDQFRQHMGSRLGIGTTGLLTLNFLHQYGPHTAGELARLTSTTSGSMTATIDKLVAQGFAERTSSQSDRRSIIVVETPKRHAAATWSLGLYRDALGQALDRHPGVDADVLIDYLTDVSGLITDAATTSSPPIWEEPLVVDELA